MGSNLDQKAMGHPDTELKTALRWRQLYGDKWLSLRERNLVAEWDKQQCQSGTCGRRHQTS